MAGVFNVFRRYWFVPVCTPNEVEVPEALDELGIDYKIKLVTDKDTGVLDGYIYIFNCIPVVYTGLKIALKSGNGYRPLEIQAK